MKLHGGYIVSHAEEHDGFPPAKWDDLSEYEYQTQYLPTPRTVGDASSHVIVNIKALVDFHAGRIEHLPDDVIYPHAWVDSPLDKPKVQLK